jgi:hypothetical protein
MINKTYKKYKKYLKNKTFKKFKKYLKKKSIIGGVGNNVDIYGLLCDNRVYLVAGIQNNNVKNIEVEYSKDQLPKIISSRPSQPSQPSQPFAFEFSTGRSNIGENFPSTFLPIYLMDENKNYIEKSGELIKFYLEKKIDEINDFLIKDISEDCKSNAKKHLSLFMKRFGTWKHLQISAAFGGETWDEYDHFRSLREFALNNDLVEKNTFVKRNDPIERIDPESEFNLLSNSNDGKMMQFKFNEFDKCPINTVPKGSVNEWLIKMNVITRENMVNISSANSSSLPPVLENMGAYRGLYNKSVNLSKIDKKVEFPRELQNAYDNQTDINELITKNIINKIHEDIDGLNASLPDITSKVKKEIEDYKIKNKDSDLIKYIPFLKYNRKNQEYSSEYFSDSDLEKTLKDIKKKYPFYTLNNKWNWIKCPEAAAAFLQETPASLQETPASIPQRPSSVFEPRVLRSRTTKEKGGKRKTHRRRVRGRK